MREFESRPSRNFLFIYTIFFLFLTLSSFIIFFKLKKIIEVVPQIFNFFTKKMFFQCMKNANVLYGNM